MYNESLYCARAEEPPWFPEHDRKVQVEIGATATLTCTVNGDSPLSLKWTKDGNNLPSISRYVGVPFFK